MDSSPPPPYSSQPQLLRPSQAHLFIAPPPPPAELPPGWRWPPYHVQGIRPTNPLLQCLFKCTYCFDGTRSSSVRYACIVLGAVLLVKTASIFYHQPITPFTNERPKFSFQVHGIIRVCIAGAAIPEANKIMKNAYTPDPDTRPYYPVVEFYARYINIYFLLGGTYNAFKFTSYIFWDNCCNLIHYFSIGSRHAWCDFRSHVACISPRNFSRSVSHSSRSAGTLVIIASYF